MEKVHKKLEDRLKYLQNGFLLAILSLNMIFKELRKTLQLD